MKKYYIIYTLYIILYLYIFFLSLNSWLGRLGLLVTMIITLKLDGIYVRYLAVCAYCALSQ